MTLVESSPDDRALDVRGSLLRELLELLSRAQLEDKLYGWNESVESNTVEVHIHSLRKKLGADVIRNVRGVGWMIAKPGTSEALR